MSAQTFSLVYLSAAAVGLATVAVVFGRRRAPGGTPLVLMLAAVSFWAVCDAVELQVATLDGKRLVSQIQYLGIVSSSPLFYHVARALSGVRKKMTRGHRLLVWGVPVVSLLMAWSNPWHGWLWSRIEPPTGASPFAIYYYGWWFWVLTAQHYVLMTLATVLLLRGMRRVAHDFRFGMAVVLAAVALPWAGNVAYNMKVGPWPGLNWLTLSLGVSGALLSWVVLRQGLLDLLPQARAALMDALKDAVIVLDPKGGVVFENEAAQRAPFNDRAALARLLGARTLVKAPDTFRSDVPLGDRRVDLRIVSVSDRWGSRAGRLIVLRDVTDTAGPAAPLVARGHDAADADFLTVCASCQRVRDDQGRWLNIEDYQLRHQAAQFTHGICPACLARLYPEVAGPAQAASLAELR
ncbi:MAG: hypothetical protein FJW23_16720 [Acidimicrobiia bacterium]|nr:hypothetical protein [Acidimicrobiia bacterium]